MHSGTDYRAPTGTALRAAHAGTVVRSTFEPLTAGNYVRIDVGDGTWIGYSHLSRRYVSVGDRVALGQVIGESGATGSATAPHLHFEVCVHGVKVNPVPFLAARFSLVDNPIAGGGTVPPVPTVPTIPDLIPLPLEDTMKLVRDAATGTIYLWTPGSRIRLSESEHTVVKTVLAAQGGTYADLGPNEWALFGEVVNRVIVDTASNMKGQGL
jgi:hypothetical protein